MIEHTKEPWRLGKFTGPSSYEKVRETCGIMDIVVDIETGPYVLASCNMNFPDDAKANARRIVACVNACAGFSTDIIELITKAGGMSAKMSATYAVAKQRDELLEALKDLEEYARGFSVSGVYLSDEIEGARLLKAACDAIAKVK